MSFLSNLRIDNKFIRDFSKGNRVAFRLEGPTISGEVVVSEKWPWALKVGVKVDFDSLKYFEFTHRIRYIDGYAYHDGVGIREGTRESRQFGWANRRRLDKPYEHQAVNMLLRKDYSGLEQWIGEEYEYDGKLLIAIGTELNRKEYENVRRWFAKSPESIVVIDAVYHERLTKKMVDEIISGEDPSKLCVKLSRELGTEEELLAGWCRVNQIRRTRLFLR